MLLADASSADLRWNDCKTRGCREAVALSDASTAPDAVPWSGQALEKSWRNVRPFQTAPALLLPDLPLVGIFSIVGKLSRTGDVEKREGGKGNTSVQQKQNCSVWTRSGQSFKPGSWSLNLTGSKSSGKALNFFLLQFFTLVFLEMQLKLEEEQLDPASPPREESVLGPSSQHCPRSETPREHHPVCTAVPAPSTPVAWPQSLLCRW